MSKPPFKYTPKYLLQEAVKWTEYGLQRGFIYLLRLLLPRRKGSLSHIDFSQAKVLFLRQNQIGDALISTPIFAALKRHYPSITLDVVLDRRNATALDGNPYIRRRYVIKQARFDFIGVLQAIRQERYDMVIDLIHSASSTSTLLCLFSGASVIGGFERENDFVYDVKVQLPAGKRMLRQLAEILRLFQIDPDQEPLRPSFYLSPSSPSFAERILLPLRQQFTHLVGVNISASSATFKFWGKENFIALLRHLRQRFPSAAFVLLYAKSYRTLAEEIAIASGAELCEETPTLSDFAAVISMLDALITPDSAAAHLADIFGVPVFILTYLPEGETAWYPSFTSFHVMHSPNGLVASIPLAQVRSASEAFLERTFAHQFPSKPSHLA
ncbi:MAG: glycosyltransferase family 9 protein [Chloroherpetonaceae bacterium]|nr:glycosyltransferase family 9 protein [Chloroherpetonaceae bacterium]MCS7211343.1 glycosyltransferase family 9 protein [Chloroherpetonaceae bacterium]MDW8020391.1 glycosyltransferase family 9 protein [Chloroherpetonaceae bacterium]MDW8465894.1 glycosyltransferase family 9 protein [Chloroherpetonaceae bacterium]